MERARANSAPGVPRAVLILGMVAPAVVAILCWTLALSCPDLGLKTAAFSRAALNLWLGGTLSRAGHASMVFDPDAFAAVMRAEFGKNLGPRTWSYPPPMLFPATALSVLPAIGSSLAWGGAGLGMLWVAGRAAGIERGPVALALVSPAALECLLDGQNGLLCAALLLPGLLLLAKRPWLAGCLLGCLLIKPQMAVLVPVCIVASRNWRAAIAAILGASALFTLSAAAFGWSSWTGFVRAVMPFMRHEILEAPWQPHTYQVMMSTPFMLSRWAGLQVPMTYAIQALISVIAVLATWRSWAGGQVEHLQRVTLTLALGAVATPYGYCYDLPALAVALSAYTSLRCPADLTDRILLGCAWIMPGTGTLLTLTGLPPLGVMGPLATVIAIRRMSARELTSRDRALPCPALRAPRQWDAEEDAPALLVDAPPPLVDVPPVEPPPDGLDVSLTPLRQRATGMDARSGSTGCTDVLPSRSAGSAICAA